MTEGSLGYRVNSVVIQFHTYSIVHSFKLYISVVLMSSWPSPHPSPDLGMLSHLPCLRSLVWTFSVMESPLCGLVCLALTERHVLMVTPCCGVLFLAV